MTHRKHRCRRIASLHLWHRYLGLSVAAFVLLLAATGLALNHTHELGLDARHVHSQWLLDWYGIRPPAMRSFETDGKRITQLGSRIYLGPRRIAEADGHAVGLAVLGGLMVLGLDDGLLLFTPDGELVERIGAGSGPPGKLRQIGIAADGRLLASTDRGTFSSGEALYPWRSVTPRDPRWSRPQPLSGALRETLLASHRGAGLSWERVLLDLHSGRILGPGGVYLMDAAALIFLILALSGAWLWNKRLRQRLGHRRAHARAERAQAPVGMDTGVTDNT